MAYMLACMINVRYKVNNDFITDKMYSYCSCHKKLCFWNFEIQLHFTIDVQIIIQLNIQNV